MKISDEQLSAFLDRELTEREMEQVRDAISENAVLADRLERLAAANELVKRHADANLGPLPESLTRRLQADNVIDISLWKRSRQFLGDHAAVAASIALVLGFAGGHLSTRTTGDVAMQQIAAHLNSVPSGETVELASDASLLSRFSFRDNQGRYCRQYQLQSSLEVSENVACYNNEGWERVATAQTSEVYREEEYRLASSTALLDSTLDAMMQGEALSLVIETDLIRNGWSVRQTE
ncbi:MAG: hypothetical protein WDZ76_10490 [Pseudohongiellaceae bacterium]